MDGRNNSIRTSRYPPADRMRATGPVEGNEVELLDKVFGCMAEAITCCLFWKKKKQKKRRYHASLASAASLASSSDSEDLSISFDSDYDDRILGVSEGVRKHQEKIHNWEAFGALAPSTEDNIRAYRMQVFAKKQASRQAHDSASQVSSITGKFNFKPLINALWNQQEDTAEGGSNLRELAELHQNDNSLIDDLEYGDSSKYDDNDDNSSLEEFELDSETQQRIQGWLRTSASNDEPVLASLGHFDQRNNHASKQTFAHDTKPKPPRIRVIRGSQPIKIAIPLRKQQPREPLLQISEDEKEPSAEDSSANLN